MTKSARNKTIDFTLDDVPAGVLEEITSDIQENPALRDLLNHTINGDSFKLMKKMPNQVIDLALVDPPYNLDKKYDGMNFKSMSVTDYQTYTQRWIDYLKPLLKNNATVYVFSDWKTSIDIAPILQKNFHVLNRITWEREKGRGALSNWKNSMEDIWFLTNSKEYNFNVDAVKLRRKVIAPYKEDGKAKDWEETKSGNFRDTMPSNFWSDISVPYWSMPENTGHPTQKPEKLLAKLILASSNEGDVIFDPFSGAGSSLVTAKKLNRNYIGIEQSLLYTAWGAYRLLQANTDKTIQGYTNGIFWERNTLGEQKKAMIEASKTLKNRGDNSDDITTSIDLFS